MLQGLKRRLRHLIAQSWWLSKAWYRLHGHSVQGQSRERVWYFAFGANMHDSAFRGRREMCPLEWRPGRIKGYRLCFNLEGRPRGRAAPANIAPDPNADVWGVLYRITRKDLVWLDCTEGVPGRRYHQVWTEAEDRQGNRIPCVTYVAESNAPDGHPSLRYITMLREGARAHDLPEHWLRHLDNVNHAE